MLFRKHDIQKPTKIQNVLIKKVAFFSFEQYVLQIIQQDVTRCCSLLVSVCGWRGFVSVWFYRKTLEGQMERVNVVPSSSSSSSALTTYSLLLSPSSLYVCSLTWGVVELGTILAVIMGYAGQHRLRAKILLKHLKMLSNIFSRFSEIYAFDAFGVYIYQCGEIYSSLWGNIFVQVDK